MSKKSNADSTSPPAATGAEATKSGKSADEVEAKSPEEWRAIVLVGKKKPHPDTWKHNAAAMLHGWAEHRHHTNRPIEIPRDAYEKALAAASEPGVDGKYTPHDAACSEFAAKRVTAKRKAG